MIYNSNDFKLAEQILKFSVDLQKDENIMVHLIGLNGIDLARALVTISREMGAKPFVQINDSEIERVLLENGNLDFWKYLAESDQLPLMKKMDAYVGIRATQNIYENSNVSKEASKAHADGFLKPVHFEERVKNTKWCIMRYPSPAFAMNAKMSTQKFTDYYYQACLLDYQKLKKAMEPLEKRLRNAKMVHLKGEGTDIELSIEGQNWVPCFGTRNIPDGEIFSSPKLDSVNGQITYTSSVYQGKPFEFVKLIVENGVVVDYDSSNNDALESILNTDEGARRFGEFSFGTNPIIEKPMYDILFDEKIYGSNHLTLGQDYDEAPNGNKSSIHWDLVCIGADVYLDDELIRKGREYITEDLNVLNPNALLQ
ncbi:MAG TPA: aminopeptidase [Balneolales bacterium]|nr:aminopeptidase [Balneolales bacterium]